MAIGVVVAGAGVAGLHYRDQLWDDRGHPDHVATMTPEPTFTVPVTLTSADELASTVVVAADKVGADKEDAKPDASSPRPTQSKAKPAVTKKPPKEETTPSESDMFSKPD